VGDNPLSASFAYDWRGRRTRKTIGFNTVTMLNDGEDCVAENGSSVVHGPFIDSPIARAGSFYVQDGLGSVTVLTDETGAVVGGHSYEPFGEVLGGTFVNPYQFTGREADGTGLNYHRARYYVPEWGRFLSEDPIGFAGGLNQYVYAENNPWTLTDPLGLTPTPTPTWWERFTSWRLDNATGWKAFFWAFHEGEDWLAHLQGWGLFFLEIGFEVFGTPGGGGPQIHEGRQGKHVPGHNDFDPARGRSELTHPDPQGLLDRFAGTGERVGQREYVEFGEEIGVYIDRTGKRVPTTRGTIHYADNDTSAHIVPAPPTAPSPPATP
jgi:RHS repeat-associated protein